jgi:uncharacterized repeat protein (TIGR03803 family)
MAYGTVFRITTNGTFTVLTNFVETNGASPTVTMTLGPDGCMYGTSGNGGMYGDEGTVFKVTTNGALRTLVSFGGAIGAVPEASVVFGPDGNLYGTTSAGGTNGTDDWGTVFRVTTNGILTTLADFGNTNGFMSEAGVAFGPDGYLYGTTYEGGSSDPNAVGEVYRLNVGLTVGNRFPSITRGAGGAVKLNLASTPGNTSRLWAATNLSLPMSNWTVLSTNVATYGFFQFTDTNTSAAKMKFYRLSTP